MYAQLCKRLDQEAPNYEQPGHPSTFRLLLLNKCKLEFDNRNAALEQFVGGNEEDEDRRSIAKGKMLGNIKFMGELGKLDILQESILHRCIQQLLTRRSEDPYEDLECLCQIMRTCGRILDTNKGRGLMDQYFERMQLLVDNADLQPRIRFMLKDAIDLRADGWVPRIANVVEGPMPINDIRPSEDDRLGFRRNEKNNDRDLGGPQIDLFRHNLRTRGGLDDMLRSITLAPSPTANLVPSGPYGPNGFGSRHNSGNQRGQFGYGGTGNQRGQYKHNQNNNRDSSKTDLAPRFKKNLIVPPDDINGLQLRPNTNLFNKATVKSNNFVNMRTTSLATSETSPTPTSIKMSTPLVKEPLPIKQASQERPKQSKKDKGPNKEEVLQKFTTVLEEYWKGDLDLKQTLNAYKEQKVPEKYGKDVILAAYIQALDKTDVEQEKVIKLIGSIKEAGYFNGNVTSEALKAFCHQLEEKENGSINAASVVLGSAVIEQLASLSEIAAITEGGNLYPLFLLVLQHIHRRRGRTEITDLFGRSKINLLGQLPENERSKERLSEVLEERDLAFLYPLLRIQAELSRQLQTEPNPQAFYRWIRDHLDPASLAEPGFVSALVTALLKHITSEASESETDEKIISDKEKTLLSKYRPVLQAFLREKLSLQLAALYSLQTHFYSLSFPRGQLLRWFMAMYDLEIVDEEAYFNWKEDVTDAYPGKGQALFQVNHWLTWLQEAESEEEEGDD
ncbi:hypothetical protein HHI36_011128 [Cryptolaemus montrouzieri]|uniref:Eukaryotic translation initiation factor 4 gamma 2 n=1 Tax=Cryptolaemus montrouzieri TaxID=559131 RepID=A0ABD2MKX7_9CUCU